MSDSWYAAHTHHWADWSLPALLRAKEATGTCISLVLPARDEAATVGRLVGRVRAALVEEVALLDEVVVIDSESSDDTAAVAAAAGATVHRAAEVRPDLGTVPGKGEALWKSLFVTNGDLLVFMDADLVDWGTHFVPGLVGPLLTDPAVHLVKGFYDRPLLNGRGHGPDQEGEGGRVTELVARPALALLFPALSEVVQPLAGEWAVRRVHMSSLRVPTGYAVDLAALVDTVEDLGLDAVAQVDLGRRAHRHQALRDLGPMALQCLAALQARAGLVSPDPVALHQFRSTPSGRAVVARDVPLTERPPAAAYLGSAA
jgi:glucosyl-3-phosphoglycerate synthase